ncbi:MAG: trigger factor [Actinobacteria bacterium]|nr:MAG: trigger factor [Actinomycetota bacterium]
MKTKVEELPESRVRLEVEDLAGSMRVPGFRKGKVPPRVVAARVGREALWDEAVRSHIDTWFWNAAERSGIQPAAKPDVELGEPPTNGTFHFSATVAVVPKPEVPDWTTLEVPAAEPDVPAELVDQELERVRDTVAELVPVERPVREGDTVVLDIVGEHVADQLDYVVEVGEGRLIEPLEQALVGASVGETKDVELEVAEGKTGTVELTVKAVKEKKLPELDDELARTASEFDSLAELRADIESRLAEQLSEEVETRFREAAVDALVGAASIEHADPLVDRRTVELWNGFVRSLERRGIPAETYLTMTGQSQQEILEGFREQAKQAVERELILEAVADREQIQVSDEEVETFIHEQSDGESDPDDLIRRIRAGGGFEQLRGDLRLRKALDAVADGVKKIPVDLARAREKLWTPEKEKGGTKMNIWTPGSEEAAK